MKTIEIILYKFDELSEAAQQNAINKLSDINVDYDWWESTYQDAQSIGLKITSFDLDRNRHADGHFLKSSLEVAELIKENHGESCNTYSLADGFLAAYDNILNDEENQDLDEVENEFLKELLEEYSIILQNESEYLQSDDAIKETILANDYDFTENGKLY